MESLRDLVYHVPCEDRPRKQPMQVLALGLSRSGTESLRNALEKLGYNYTYHGFDVALIPGEAEIWYRLGVLKWSGEEITATHFDEVLGHCSAITDMPAAAFAPELIAAYPNAQVILNTRGDVDAWYRSNMETFGNLNMTGWSWWLNSWFCADLYWITKSFENPFYRYFYGDFASTGKWVQRDHAATIRGLVSPERLLEWQVQDGWAPLCRFLGKNVPEEDFPKGNAPAQFMATFAKRTKEQQDTARRNMSIFVGGCCLLVAAVAAAVYQQFV